MASRVNNRAAAALVARSGPSAVAGFPVDAPGGPGGGGGHVGDDADSTTGRLRDRQPVRRGAVRPSCRRDLARWRRYRAGDAWWPVGRDSPVRFPGCPAVNEPGRGGMTRAEALVTDRPAITHPSPGAPLPTDCR